MRGTFPPLLPAIRLIQSLPPRLPVALDLILAIGALILLGVMIHSLVSRIFRPPLFADRKSPKWFKHLFPFCIFPLFIMFPEPVKRPVMRQRKNTWSVLSFRLARVETLLTLWMTTVGIRNRTSARLCSKLD